jgi:hypothetical protein
LTTAGDLAVTTGNLTTVTDGAAILQAVKTRLKLFLGEWFLDTRAGVPYYQTILVKRPDEAAVEAALKRTILGTPGVVRLTSYTQAWTRSTRTMTVTFKATTEDGETIAASEVLAA